MIDLKHFKLIEAVAESGNLTKAGEKLFLSQSALSHQLSDLETGLGTPVFHRINKRLTLTPAGKLLLETGEKIFNDLEKLKTEINKGLNGENGVVRICTECYTCYNWLPNVIKQFNMLYPNVQIEINTDNFVKPLELIRKREADVALIFRNEADKGMVYSEFFDDELIAVVHKGHVLAKKEYVTAKDFTKEVYYTHVKNHAGSYLAEKFFDAANVKPSKVIHFQLTDAIIEMVKAGLGVAIMNRWALKNYFPDKNLKFIPLTKKKLFRRWSFATSKEMSERGYIKKLCELIKEEIKK